MPAYTKGEYLCAPGWKTPTHRVVEAGDGGVTVERLNRPGRLRAVSTDQLRSWTRPDPKTYTPPGKGG